MFSLMSNTLFHQVLIDLLSMDEEKAIEELEAWRCAQKLTKVELARLLGLKNSQVYTNWVRRKTISKPFLHSVAAVLSSRTPKEARDLIREASSGTNMIRYAEIVKESREKRTLRTGVADQGAEAKIRSLLASLPPGKQIEFYIEATAHLSPSQKADLAMNLLESARSSLPKD